MRNRSLLSRSSGSPVPVPDPGPEGPASGAPPTAMRERTEEVSPGGNPNPNPSPPGGALSRPRSFICSWNTLLSAATTEEVAGWRDLPPFRCTPEEVLLGMVSDKGVSEEVGADGGTLPLVPRPAPRGTTLAVDEVVRGGDRSGTPEEVLFAGAAVCCTSSGVCARRRTLWS